MTSHDRMRVEPARNEVDDEMEIDKSPTGRKARGGGGGGET